MSLRLYTPPPEDDDPLDEILRSYPELGEREWEPEDAAFLAARFRESDPGGNYAGPPAPPGPAIFAAGTELKVRLMMRRAGYCMECPRCRDTEARELAWLAQAPEWQDAHPEARPRWTRCLSPVQLFHPQDAPADGEMFDKPVPIGANGMLRGLGKERARKAA